MDMSMQMQQEPDTETCESCESGQHGCKHYFCMCDCRYPLPWGESATMTHNAIQDANGETVAYDVISATRPSMIRKRILRAVNNHDALVEALTAVLQVARKSTWAHITTGPCECKECVIANATKALSAAFEDKPMDQEEVKPTGASAEIGRQEQPEWRYVETTHSAVVVAGNIQLYPRWNGLANTDEVRAVVRKAAAAHALYAACKAMQKSLNGSATDFAGMLAAHRQLDAAVALVDGPQTKDNDMNNEQVEVEDDRRCSECGSEEAGNCFYCKAD